MRKQLQFLGIPLLKYKLIHASVANYYSYAVVGTSRSNHYILYKEREFISPTCTKFTTVFYWKFLFDTVDTLVEDCRFMDPNDAPKLHIISSKQLAIMKENAKPVFNQA